MASNCSKCGKAASMLPLLHPSAVVVSMENQKTEDNAVIELEIDAQVIRFSVCCGAPIKQGLFYAERDVYVRGHFGEGHTLIFSGKDSIAEDIPPEDRFHRAEVRVTTTVSGSCSCGDPVIFSDGTTEFPVTIAIVKSAFTPIKAKK